MTKRKVKYKPNNVITQCPKCGNNTEFTIHSDYCAEDCCEVWAVCKCGYDPTSEEGETGNRVEDFWGDIENDFMFWKFNPDFDIKFKKELSEPVNN